MEDKAASPTHKRKREALPVDTREPAERATKKTRATVDGGGDDADDDDGGEGRLEALPNEMIARIKLWLDPASSKLFRSTCHRFRDTTTDSDRMHDTVHGPLARSVVTVLDLLDIPIERLRDFRPPREAKKHWPALFSKGRTAALAENEIKRYVLNAILLHYLQWSSPGHLGLKDDCDEINFADDELKRWRYIKSPPAPVNGKGKQVGTITFAFEMCQGQYEELNFKQDKGSNYAGIDLCHESARAVVEHVFGLDLPFPFRMFPYSYGGKSICSGARKRVRVIG